MNPLSVSHQVTRLIFDIGLPAISEKVYRQDPAVMLHMPLRADLHRW